VFWDGRGENPYFGYLGLADAVIVTADSVTMISEAAATGKPVHVAALEGGSAKFRRFHAAMQEAGVTRPFAGRLEDWRYEPLDEAARIATEVRRRLELAGHSGRGRAGGA
jgi:mitochondrial fission protein ELM1